MTIRMADLYTLAQRPGGVSVAEARQHYDGCKSHDLAGRLDNMADSGRLARVAAKGPRTTKWRYVADPAQSWALCEQRYRERARIAKEKRLEEGRKRLQNWQAADAAAAAKRKKRVAEQWREVNGQRVKVPVEICPSGTDQRFTPGRVPKVFASLAVGIYLPSDTAISRSAA